MGGLILNNGLNDLVSYWKSIFSSPNPIEALGLQNDDKVMMEFELDIPPEPYYGYFHEQDAMKNDVLLLLLNPGGKNEQARQDGWNDFVTNRYVNFWSINEYFRQEELLKEKNPPWRDQRFNQAKGIVGDFGFLHTMEFFPFHSKYDKLPDRFKKRWVKDYPMSDLAFYAIKDIATQRKVKHIFSVSKDWIRIFEKHHVPLKVSVELMRHTGKEYSFKFKVYEFGEDTLPILFCELNGSPINLPTNEFAVHIARILLGISKEPIPEYHPEFQIIVEA